MDVAFYLVYPESAAARAKLAAFRNRLLTYAAASPSPANEPVGARATPRAARAAGAR